MKEGGTGFLYHLGMWITSGLNVFTGGSSRISFSARSWQLARRGHWYGRARVAVVDGLNRLFTGERDHCRKAFEWYVANGLAED